MALEVWLLYVSTVLVFMSTPGPSHLLMLSNSMRHGFKPSLATAAGDLSANALQMLAAGLGLAAFLVSSQHALSFIKWAGVAYLLWMGVNMWRHSSQPDRSRARASAEASSLALWTQGFLTSAANPKAVVFFAALFPQFIQQGEPLGVQFLLLSATYLTIDGLFLTAYGAGAGWAAKRLQGQAAVALEKLGASFLIGAAVLLGLKTLQDNR